MSAKASWLIGRFARLSVAAVAAVAVAGACNFAQEGASGSGGTGSGGGSGGADGGGGDGGVGANCTVATTSGAMLCTQISLCPGVTVDQNTWNGCGFIPDGKLIVLECECSGYLCSVTPTPTCAATKALLATMTSDQTCAQLSTGTCLNELLQGSGSGSGGSTCNQSCVSQCVGDPVCVQGCGC